MIDIFFIEQVIDAQTYGQNLSENLKITSDAEIDQRIAGHGFLFRHRMFLSGSGCRSNFRKWIAQSADLRLFNVNFTVAFARRDKGQVITILTLANDCRKGAFQMQPFQIFRMIINTGFATAQMRIQLLIAVNENVIRRSVVCWGDKNVMLNVVAITGNVECEIRQMIMQTQVGFVCFLWNQGRIPDFVTQFMLAVGSQFGQIRSSVSRRKIGAEQQFFREVVRYAE